jgi:segregation and condensation protein B
MKQLMSKIESLLFVTGEDGLTLKQIVFLTEEPERKVLEAIETLKEDYHSSGIRGIELKELAGTYQLVTKAEHAESIQKLIENPTSQALTQASLEVLAIIAYKQPITRIEIEDLRGVKSERPIHTLASRGLITEVGRAEGTGRAILYGTTNEFLNHFGLNSLNELPELTEPQDSVEEETDLFMTKFQEVFEEQGE